MPLGELAPVTTTTLSLTLLGGCQLQFHHRLSFTDTLTGLQCLLRWSEYSARLQRFRGRQGSMVLRAARSEQSYGLLVLKTWLDDDTGKWKRLCSRRWEAFCYPTKYCLPRMFVQLLVSQHLHLQLSRGIKYETTPLGYQYLKKRSA